MPGKRWNKGTQDTVRVTGVGTVLRAVKGVEHDIPLRMERALQKSAEIVRDDARPRFEKYNPKVAGQFRARRSGGTAYVDNPARKTTGLRPKFGGLQVVKGLKPALAAKSDEVREVMEDMVDDIIRRNDIG